MSDAYVAWPVSGVQYASIHIPLRDTYVAPDGTTHERSAEEMIAEAHDVASQLYRAFPPPGAQQPKGAAAPAQQPQGNSGGQQHGQGRAARFDLVPGEQCDQCKGPCGVKPRTGAQTSDGIVCLGRCTDPNPNGQDYVHRVRWADSQPVTAGSTDVDPDDLPF